MDFLEYEFLRNALTGVVIISVAAAMIGTYIIARRLIAISGGITHACFGGLGMGYYFGVSPVLTAAIFAVASALGVQWMSKRFDVREDSSIAVIWAVGMAVGVLFVFLTPGFVPELNSFLFGNILTITPDDIVLFAAFTGVLIAFYCIFYRQIVSCAFDPDFAKVIHLPVNFITYTMTVLVAVCIVLTIRLVGVMLLMSMLSLPMMTAEIFFRRYTPLMLLSVVISVVAGVAGLFVGTMVDVPCSAIIVIIMLVIYLCAKLISLAPRNKC